ncbi:2-nitropropane dioxygenase [Obba rivulosa]|uniref:2-nitropropane dioxygenase n=1 Tax=Obba rivulosa TaxID=1052685 RepID=A0A8E2DKZ9_9APHY|nr:2-nitropropane dioxygenase [Obba rivulosa]
MSRIQTSVTRLLGVRSPIVAAPMAGASTVRLALEASRGGGFGFTAAGYGDAQMLHSDLQVARTVSSVEMRHGLPIGVGFLGWQLDQQPSALDMLRTVRNSDVQAVWFAFGKDLGRWINHVRELDSHADDGRKTIIFVQVNSLREALVAVHEWKVDVLVAQGIESGGHGNGSAPSTFTLVSSILSALPHSGPPVLAAGGLANGTHAAAYLTLGCAGAVFGTRFLLTPESLYTDAQKAALISAGPESTVRTMAFDQARGTLGWPNGVDGRAIRNETVADVEAGVDMQEVKKKFQEAVNGGDPTRMLVWAGEGVHLMREIKGAKVLVEEIHSEMVLALESAGLLVQHD